MIQSFTATDLERIAHLQPEGWQNILVSFRFYLNARFCLPLKIEDKNHIVAIGSVILHRQTAWLAHIIVEPEMRRKRLGSLITQELIATAENNGRNIQLLIATREGEQLYEQLGFRQSCDYTFYQQSVYEAADVSNQVRSSGPADTAEILAMDQRASGEDRSALLSSYVGSGWVYAGPEASEIRGYFLPDLGEGIIVAQDVEAGTALQRLRLATVETAPVLPSGNHAANELLLGSGLKPEHSAARMVRNGDDPLDQNMVFNRVGGHLG